MSSAYTRRGSDGSDSSMTSSSDYDSSSKGSVPSSLPSLDDRNISVESNFDAPPDPALFGSNPHTSALTYCTTVASFDDEENGDYSCYFEDKPERNEAVPATPQEFAQYFPSTKRLSIKHDDSTLDGNMNVRVDTEAPTRNEQARRITLFHLRMYDLRDRDFSVRRYGRECGREVAHIKRKVIKSSSQRPTLQRSVSKALHSFRGKTELDEFKVERRDSGYGSNEDDDKVPCSTPGGSKLSNTCTMEFSNYAHVDITRRGTKSSKRYDFEYWGKGYSWKRTIRMAGLSEDVSYQLVNNATNNVVACIQPDALTPSMAAAEEAKGGFIPPCSMWIKNSLADPVNSENADVADVIVTTGLITLVDDCIKRKFHKKKSVQLVLPKTPLKMNMEYVGPKRFIDEMFHRRPIVSRSNSVQISSPMNPSPPQRMFTG